MMEEVEDAVMEEEIERAASIPPEMLHEDESSSSSSSISHSQDDDDEDEDEQLDSLGGIYDDEDYDQSDKSRKELEEEANRLEVRRSAFLNAN